MTAFRGSPSPAASYQGNILHLSFLKNPAPLSMNDHGPITPGLRSKTLLGFRADNGPKPQFSSAVQFTQQGCGVYMEHDYTQAGLQATRGRTTYTHCQRTGLD